MDHFSPELIESTLVWNNWLMFFLMMAPVIGIISQMTWNEYHVKPKTVRRPSRARAGRRLAHA